MVKKLVVLGGGYGGLTVVRELLGEDSVNDVEITLVDRLPYHGLKTEFYALAAGTLPETDIRVPFPDDPRLNLFYGEVIGVDLERKMVLCEDGRQLDYDWLVIALGCVDKYHGIEGAKEHTHSIQTFAWARRTYTKANEVRPGGSVTIVGGGLSGVEMAAELRESRPDMNLRIIDRGNGILSSFPVKVQEYVREWFDEHNVDMLPHISIRQVEPGRLEHEGGVIDSDCIVWTAGIQPSPIVQQMQVPKDNAGRVLLNEYYQIPHYPDVYVVGDCASLPHSPSAQAAEAQGEQVAGILQSLWLGETPKLSPIKLKGILGALGRKSGFGLMGESTIMLGKVPRMLKSGVLWMSKHHFG
jgi:NADH dehydrogenase